MEKEDAEQIFTISEGRAEKTILDPGPGPTTRGVRESVSASEWEGDGFRQEGIDTNISRFHPGLSWWFLCHTHTYISISAVFLTHRMHTALDAVVMHKIRLVGFHQLLN